MEKNVAESSETVKRQDDFSMREERHLDSALTLLLNHCLKYYKKNSTFGANFQ
jgi:hypothetical protein